MKKLLIVVLLIISGICYAFENSTTQFPQAQFQSVNNIQSNCMYQSNITPVEAIDIHGNVYTGTYSPRRVKINDDPGDPFATPIGEASILYLLIGGYLLYKIKPWRIDL